MLLCKGLITAEDMQSPCDYAMCNNVFNVSLAFFVAAVKVL